MRIASQGRVSADSRGTTLFYLYTQTLFVGSTNRHGFLPEAQG